MTATLDTPPTDLTERIDALDEAVGVLANHLDATDLAEATALIGRARARLGHGTDHTVVAVAGQTGAGKSSLVNALVGQDVARVAVTRPTTQQALAVIHGEGGDALLDWLQVRDRHRVPAPDGLDGLILLDLPDMDSVATAHRVEADRLVGLADLLVFVTDPEKYADEVLHDEELAALAARDVAVHVVLNQADRLTPDEVATCLARLTELLAADGLGEVAPRAVSALTGHGLDDLRAKLAETVTRRQAAVDRLDADLRIAATHLVPDTTPAPDERQLLTTATDGLAGAIGTGDIAAIVAAQYRHDAALATGWPITRWLRRLRRAPVTRAPRVAGTRTAQGAVRATLRAVGEQAGAGIGPPWDRIIRDHARGRADEVAGALDHVTTAGLESLRDRPGWWRATGGLQGLLVVAAMAGAAWLGLLVLADSFLLLDVEALTLKIRGIPLPTLLLAGGLGMGVVVAWLAGSAARFGARRRQRRANRDLQDQVAQVAGREVLAPLAAVHADRHRVAERLATAAG